MSLDGRLPLTRFETYAEAGGEPSAAIGPGGSSSDGGWRL
jgi:hypothetical protein